MPPLNVVVELMRDMCEDDMMGWVESNASEKGIMEI